MAETQPPWRVELIDREKQADALRRWVGQAIALGIGEAFSTAYSRIVHSLLTDPEAYGDPLYNLPTGRGVCYHRLESPLQVIYIVHQDARVVWIQHIQPQEGLGFTER